MNPFLPITVEHLFYLSQAAIGIWILGYTLQLQAISYRMLDNLKFRRGRIRHQGLQNIGRENMNRER
jgi:hypothetical protein